MSATVDASVDVIGQLRLSLESLPPPPRYQVAFSGGLDSHVLLHALVALRAGLPAPLTAIHIHHGLSPHADHWAQHCAAVCAGLAVPFSLVRVAAHPGSGESREAAARAARYAALAESVADGALLLTAHHLDDQAETLLLMLLRGAGPRGLAAMPLRRPLGAGHLARPLLNVPRPVLQAYARQQQLHWIEDESNFDTSLDRNFLRHEVLPLLQRRWPAAAAVLARSTRHMAETAALLAALAEGDRAVCGGAQPGTLSVHALLSLEDARRRNLLRHWLQQAGLPLPDGRQLQRLANEMLTARDDAMPLVAWPGAEVRRYRDDLHAMAPLPPVPPGPWHWDMRGPLELPGLGRLIAEPATGQGLRACDGVAVGFRQGGERCQPLGRRHHHELKKLFQDAGIPPWERERIPLIMREGVLAQAGELWLCAGAEAAPGQAGMIIRWQRPSVVATAAENNDNYAGPSA